MRRFLNRSGLLTFLLGLVPIGCGGPDHQAICEEVEDCAGGNDKDVAACVADLDYIEEVSSYLGCSDEYETAVECVQENATCKDKRWQLHGDAEDRRRDQPCRARLIPRDCPACRSPSRGVSSHNQRRRVWQGTMRESLVRGKGNLPDA